MRKRVKAIFFDIDDTLYCTTDFSSLARRNAVNAMVEMGLNYPADLLYQELQEVVKEFTSNYNYHFDKLLLRVPASSYHGINRCILIAAAVIAYHQTKPNHLKPYPDVEKLLQYLNSHSGLIVGVVTAGSEIKQAEKLLRLGLYRYFHPEGIFISDQIGISKPNVKLYEIAYQNFQLPPEEVIYVGDNPEKDIDPPNKLNMITVRFRKDGKYKSNEGATQPDFEIKNFAEFTTILQENFELGSA